MAVIGVSDIFGFVAELPLTTSIIFNDHKTEVSGICFQYRMVGKLSSTVEDIKSVKWENVSLYKK